MENNFTFFLSNSLMCKRTRKNMGMIGKVIRCHLLMEWYVDYEGWEGVGGDQLTHYAVSSISSTIDKKFT